MDTKTIIAELEAERDRLAKAIAALQGRSIGRGTTASNAEAGSSKRGRRRLSAAARKRISEAMKKSWAAKKKAA